MTYFAFSFKLSIWRNLNAWRNIFGDDAATFSALPLRHWRRTTFPFSYHWSGLYLILKFLVTGGQKKRRDLREIPLWITTTSTAWTAFLCGQICNASNGHSLQWLRPHVLHTQCALNISQSQLSQVSLPPLSRRASRWPSSWVLVYTRRNSASSRRVWNLRKFLLKSCIQWSGKACVFASLTQRRKKRRRELSESASFWRKPSHILSH